MSKRDLLYNWNRIQALIEVWETNSRVYINGVAVSPSWYKAATDVERELGYRLRQLQFFAALDGVNAQFTIIVTMNPRKVILKPKNEDANRLWEFVEDVILETELSKE